MPPARAEFWRYSYVILEEFYCAAVLETNPERLGGLIREAETALFIRELELAVGLDGRTERLEIEHAASALRILTSESKGWVRTRTGLAISPAGQVFAI